MALEHMLQDDAARNNSSSRERKKPGIWLSKWRSRRDKQTGEKTEPARRPRPNPSGVTETGQMPPSSNSSSSSSSSSFQHMKLQRQSSPSCDLSSGYLSQTNGSAAARRPNRPEPAVASRCSLGDRSNLHYVPTNSERQAKINAIQHSHSIASSSTLTRLPMVPMKIDDEDEFVLVADENNGDETELDDGQNLALHDSDELDFSHQVHYLDQHPGYLAMIDGSKLRRHQLEQLRQLQQQQQLQRLQIFRQQHQYHIKHHHQQQQQHQQRPHKLGDKLESAMRFEDSLGLHQNYLTSRRLVNDELAAVINGECADSDQTLAPNQRYRFAAAAAHINHQYNQLDHLAGLDYVLAASQNSATLGDAYDDQQLDEGGGDDDDDGDEYGPDGEQLASLAPSQLYNHQLLLLGALGVDRQRPSELQRLQSDIVNTQTRILRGSSGGVGADKRNNRNLPQFELVKRAVRDSHRSAAPIAQDVSDRRNLSLNNSSSNEQALLQAMSKSHRSIGNRNDQPGQQHSKLNSVGNDKLSRAASSKTQLNPNQSAAFRQVPKSATSGNLLLGDPKRTQAKGAANMVRSTSQMDLNMAMQHSNTGSYHQGALTCRPAPMGCCGRLAKFLLFIANVLFWCTGVALGAWGILALVEDHKYNLSQLLVFEPNSRMSLFQLLSWSFITLGGATILIGICGCSALFKNSRWILGLYIFLILAIFALDLATGLLAIIFQERLVTNVRLKLVNKMRTEYGIQASFTAAIDYIQTHYECCGLEGHFDYEQSLWRLQRLGGFEATVARTCCHLRNTLDDQAHVNPRPVNESMCQSTDVRLHQSYRFRRGCLDDLERLIRYKIWTFTVGCGIVGAIILVVLTLATCFCRSIPNGTQKEASKLKSSKLSSRNNNPNRTHQQALMYAETVAKKQGHYRHGQHDHR